ncbi:MAG: aspartate aminotransferase family protein [Deltaproteobacteria bacterium]|nr:aspartate aminotransferase family protein [Deltaproteobacteria bacterium]
MDKQVDSIEQNQSKLLLERASNVMPGPQSNLRAPVGVIPLFAVKGEGAHIWDVDGNEYIDFMCGAGSGLLGYRNIEYIETLKEQLDTLYYLVSGAAQTPLEVEVAERFVQYVPCAEKIRFCVTGTEAVQLAIRLARAYTRRPYFIRFEGHYHGWLDNVLGGVSETGSKDRPFAVESEEDPLYTEGRAPGAFKESFKLPWNDVRVLEEILREYGEEVAMIHMEPVMCNGGCCPPRPGYLEKVRELCTRYGIVLSFDEVITGFRIGLSGAQGLFGVTPDIATFGKGLAAGFPIGVVAGKRELMDLLLERRVISAGTFNGYPMGVAASLATLRVLERDEGAFYRKIDELQGALMDGLKELCNRHGIPSLIQGPRGVFCLHFTDKESAYSIRDLRDADVDLQNRFRMLMAQEGVLIMWGGRWYLSGGHRKEDIDNALEAADRVLGRLKGPSPQQ